MGGVGMNDIPVSLRVLGLGDNEMMGIALIDFGLFGFFDLFGGRRFFGCHINW